MKIICFILAYKIIKLGYNLISAGVKGEFKFSSQLLGFKADLVSISPGLLFVLLGVLLMMIAIYINKTVTLQTTRKVNTNKQKNTGSFYSDSIIMPGGDDFEIQDSTTK